MMKETWSLPRAVEGLLEERACQYRLSTLESHFTPPALELYHHKNLHVSSDVNITAGYRGGAEEDVSTVATPASNLHRVLTAMGGRTVEADCASLIAARREDRPFSLVPPAFEVVGDLGEGEGEESKGEQSCLTEHCCG